MIKTVNTENGISTVTVECPSCGKESIVRVDSTKLKQYLNGEIFAQDMELSPDEAELFISGTCSECWEKMFNYEEDEC